MTVYVRSVSEKDFYYNGWQTEVAETVDYASIANPGCSQRELRIYMLPYDGSEVSFTGLELSEGQFMTPAFFSGSTTAQAVIPADTGSVTVSLAAPENATVRFGYSALKPNEDGVYTQTIDTTNASTTRTYTMVLNVIEGEGEDAYTRLLQQSLSITLSKPDENVELLPNAVVDHLAPLSQYTNGRQTIYTDGRQYGIYPERSLIGAANWEGVTSLGNFGGHIVWKYDEPIKNDPSHAYGVDFCVYGNAYSSGYGTEAGQVWVSKDGETWYALAGSEHFEDKVIWDYTVTYENTNSSYSFDWSDNYGNGGTWFNAAVGQEFPDPAIYALHSFDGEDKLTLSGVLLKGYVGTEIKENPYCMYKSSEMFGYVDALASDPAYGEGGGGAAGNAQLNPENPYAQTNMGSSFDISWAVDANGMPVYLDEISYVKVQTAVFANGGVMGEASTEVSTALRVPNGEESKGVTAAPESIVISQSGSNAEIELTAEDFTAVEGSLNTYKADLDVGTLRNLLFTVNSAESDNIYVNNQPVESGETTGRAYVVAKDDGRVVRIIVQNGEKEPLSYFINITSQAVVSDTILNVETLIGAIGTVSRDSGDAIKAARKAYDALTSEEKQIVSNYGVLTAAEADYEALTSEQVGTSENKINVTITAEKFVLGQGYIMEPTLVSVPDDTTISQILVALLGIDDVNFSGSTSSSSFYLAYLGDEEEEPNIPKKIMDKLGDQYHGTREYSDWLGEFD